MLRRCTHRPVRRRRSAATTARAPPPAARRDARVGQHVALHEIHRGPECVDVIARNSKRGAVQLEADDEAGRGAARTPAPA